MDSTYNGTTILHLLAIGNNKEVIELILEKIDPNKLSKVINAVDKKKCAPLDYAAIYGHLEVIKYLIEKGSDLDIGSNRDLTPLHWAALNGQLQVVKQ
ncbi:ankyrin repeat domain-containing protein [Wolbachia endosymbiont of Nilaparvata lugens]|uniref:ankyrin repeat domain-containing protein n=1 Tax=Wolbachia endosymbiont of Nilaparvata lugens TaxID=357143 RepID=UPI0011810075